MDTLQFPPPGQKKSEPVPKIEVEVMPPTKVAYAVKTTLGKSVFGIVRDRDTKTNKVSNYRVRKLK